MASVGAQYVPCASCYHNMHVLKMFYEQNKWNGMHRQRSRVTPCLISLRSSDSP